MLSKPPEGWKGEQGFITAEMFKRHLPPPYADHEYFICGPDVMMNSIEKALADLGVPRVLPLVRAEDENAHATVELAEHFVDEQDRKSVV